MINDEIKEMLENCEKAINEASGYNNTTDKILDYITNLQQENKIKDTNWESLKYYLEKLYYKDYIEETISDDIDKKIKELESKVEIKGYQKDIKELQQENEYSNYCNEKSREKISNLEYKITELEEINKQHQELNGTLRNENERLKEENIEIRQCLLIKRRSIPHKLTMDKSIKEILDMPTYEDYKSRVENAVEYINNFSVDKSFSFPLMKRWEENQVKASIDYEFNDTLKKDLLNILQDKEEV